MKAQNIKKYLHSRWFLALACVLLGAAAVFGVRFITYQVPETTHYHANFAVYIDGRREEFKGLNYYEETATTVCSLNPDNEEGKPMDRVHMHGSVNDIVHVEDKLVTWGNFFTVLGWNVGDNYVANRDAVYQTADHKKVTYILNGKPIDSIANMFIGDQDKLLVNYGDQTADQIKKEYNAIQNKAAESDNSSDPAGCGGGSHANSTMRDRFMHMF